MPLWAYKPLEAQKAELASIELPKVVDPTTTVTPVPTKIEQKQNATKAKILAYTKSYGGRIDEKYLDTIAEACGNDWDTVRVIVAISVAETGMGKTTKKKSNFWGYYKGGNRKYDPSREQMAKDMCKSMKGTYKNLIVNGSVNMDLAKLYSGSAGDIWSKNVKSAYIQMQ